MFYFRKTPFYTTDDKELSQFQKVIRFRKKLEKLGVLFWEYEQLLKFERDVREHLMRQILELTEPKTEPQVMDSPPRVFMSCAREDSERVVPVYRALVAAGFLPWLDIEDLLPGETWAASIQNAIREANFFLVFLSEASASKRGYVQKEISLALDVSLEHQEGETYIIPVRLDSVEPPLRLTRYQWVDLFSPNGMEKLIFALRSAWQSIRM